MSGFNHKVISTLLEMDTKLDIIINGLRFTNAEHIEKLQAELKTWEETAEIHAKAMHALEDRNQALRRKLDLVDYYVSKSTFQELTGIAFTYENFSQYTPLEEDGYKWLGFIERFKEIKEME